MPPLDITDLETHIDDLLHDVPPSKPKPTPIPIPFPTYPDDETQHLYSLKIPMPVWRALKQHVGKGNIAQFIRQAIYNELARLPPQHRKENQQ